MTWESIEGAPRHPGKGSSVPSSYVQVIDALAPGGAERTAVMLANELAARGATSSLVTTRAGGRLVEDLDPTVSYRCLERSGRVGARAALSLRRCVDELDVDVVHVHGSSIHFVAAALIGRHRPAIVWHDHNSRLSERSLRVARHARRSADLTYVVSQDILEWHATSGVRRPGPIELLPNFVDDQPIVTTPSDLPGAPGRRVVAVGNLRPEKNHLGTVRAFERVVIEVPGAHLLCIGAAPDEAVHAEVLGEISRLGLADRVHLLGQRTDVAAVLAASAVGVLFSWAEGQSIALLEYGRAGLPAVVSRVGSAKGLADRTSGVVVVEPGDETRLADGVIALLSDDADRDRRGADFRRFVELEHSAPVVVPRIIERYESLIGQR